MAMQILLHQPPNIIQTELLMLPPRHLVLFANASRECRTVADLVKKKKKEISCRSWKTVTAGGRTMSIPPFGIATDHDEFGMRVCVRVVASTPDTSLECLTFADVQKQLPLLKPSVRKFMVNDYWKILSRDCRHNMDDANILLDRSLMGENDADVVIARLHEAAARTGGILWLAKKSVPISNEDDKKWKLISEGIAGILGDSKVGFAH